MVGAFMHHVTECPHKRNIRNTCFRTDFQFHFTEIQLLPFQEFAFRCTGDAAQHRNQLSRFRNQVVTRKIGKIAEKPV